ncbi:hypothetical protein M3N55_04625 [Roseibaca sp. V10]|uniref:DUF2497 domain-containing protein n=1 Tax=Roseinatronobacter domitianus TaxID=2940293 RepID=A0ABT0LZG5_9RHOB|nr:hypothetical protein [Roseibaca domitiana]MCL1628006.1 hypothetical protein [Roseibaca domitiana]
MTEAMSRHEIEDVLSSIRRLVSHDEHPAHPKPATPGKLVLTSALRVDDGPDTAQDPKFPEVETKSDPAPETLQSVIASKPDPVESPRHPSFADAALRAPLLTRIAQAGQGAAQIFAAPTASGPMVEPDVEGETQLEETLARLEKALAIAPAEAAEAAEAAGATEAAETADTVIDEDALAELVARIVRQELQGELGERITRNIRKLVRAEVARELQMRNL